jgi:superoxide dismutase, Fe-Mn family
MSNKTIEEILKNSVSETFAVLKPKKTVEEQAPKLVIKEALVAQAKHFRQVSEYVSQSTKDKHVELYQGYIDSMNRNSAELDGADRSSANSNHSTFKSLKTEESRLINSVWLHELYFANCFDPQSEITMDAQAYMKLQKDFGTFDDWQRDFSAAAMSAGEGWAICGYHVFLKRYVNTIVNDHSQNVLIGLIPAIVIDMWSHAYYRDYATDKKSYLIAMMKELNWRVIEERFEKIEALKKVYK